MNTVLSVHDKSQIVKLPPVGSLLPAQQQKLTKAFQMTAGDLFEEPGDITEWPGVKFMRQLVKRGTSCVIKGEPGAGKATAAAFADEEVEDMLTILAPSLPRIYLELWDALGQPIKPYRIELGKDGWVCKGCHLNCLIDKNATLKPQRDDIREFLFKEAEGKLCPLIMKLVNRALSTLPSPIVIRLPYIPKSEIKHLLGLLRRLLAQSELILLADPEQDEWLQISELRMLQRVPFPRPDVGLLYGIIASRMKRAGVDRFPISQESLNLLAMLTRCNPGKFTQLVNLALLSWSGLVEPRDILAMVAAELDERSMTALALSRHPEGSWIRVIDLGDTIYELFGREIGNERLGRLLRRLGLKHRRNNGAEYYNKARLRAGGIKSTTRLK